ncbi:hypothetical protein F4680DRAFT_405750 [Xylaria scruposa]|nr:hypothetical protein F4680DRAFT_405750 [Xylaria scruposa]
MTGYTKWCTLIIVSVSFQALPFIAQIRVLSLSSNGTAFFHLQRSILKWIRAESSRSLTFPDLLTTNKLNHTSKSGILDGTWGFS